MTRKNQTTKTTICKFLQAQRVPYEIIKNGYLAGSDSPAPQQDSCTPIQTAQVCKPVLLKNKSTLDDNSFVLVAIPGNRLIDLGAMKKLLNFKLEPVQPHDYAMICSNHAPGLFLPVAQQNHILTVVDDALYELDEIVFKTESDNEYIKVDNKAFRDLHKNAKVGRMLSIEQINSGLLRSEKTHTTGKPDTSSFNIKKQMEQITELPPMPDMAQKIILLNANPYATAEDLAALIELDPSLTAQILAYARSPFFNYRGEISSISQAISRVLGYDMVMNIALGLSAAAPFKNQRHGPLGLDAFWKHAIYSATLSQMICKQIPERIHLDCAMCYLAGLLHNFGFLILGHLFNEQFTHLNNAVMQQPDKRVTDLELELLNIDHTITGAWLMQAWNMPPEIITCIQEHHNENYDGDKKTYIQVILLADRLLKSMDIGEAECTDLPESILTELSLTPHQLHDCLETLFRETDSLDTIANSIAA